MMPSFPTVKCIPCRMHYSPPLQGIVPWPTTAFLALHCAAHLSRSMHMHFSRCNSTRCWGPSLLSGLIVLCPGGQRSGAVLLCCVLLTGLSLTHTAWGFPRVCHCLNTYLFASMCTHKQVASCPPTPTCCLLVQIARCDRIMIWL